MELLPVFDLTALFCLISSTESRTSDNLDLAKSSSLFGTIKNDTRLVSVKGVVTKLLSLLALFSITSSDSFRSCGTDSEYLWRWCKINEFLVTINLEECLFVCSETMSTADNLSGTFTVSKSSSVFFLNVQPEIFVLNDVS